MEHIIIAGGSGELGSPLISALSARGYHVTNISRSGIKGKAHASIRWSDDLASVFDGAKAVVNLAGANVGEGRWNSVRRSELIRSRVDTTSAIATAILKCSSPPAFIATSAVGYYGNSTTPVTEGHPPGSTFFSELCKAWEQAAHPAEARTRVAIMRIGVVLDPSFGALHRLLPFFRIGLGGPLGNGLQGFPWVHRKDVIDAYIWAIEGAAHGAYNVVAPESVTMRDFATALGQVLRRPSLFPVPAALLRLLLGRQADIVLHGQHVVSARLPGMGFEFHYPTLKGALQDLLGTAPKA